jgi:hypothetical protein
MNFDDPLIDLDEATALTEILREEFGLRPITVRFNRRLRAVMGRYIPAGCWTSYGARDLPTPRIEFGPCRRRDPKPGVYRFNLTDEVNVSTVVHELAHHYQHTGLIGYRHKRGAPYHDADFQVCLDKLTDAAIDLGYDIPHETWAVT